MNESLSQDQSEAAAFVFEPRLAASSAWQWVRRHVAELLCAFFVAVMSFNMLTVIARKSITNDEIVMIPAAYYHLVSGDFQVVNEHPPLPKIIAALPLLFIQPNEARSQDFPQTANPGERTWKIQEHFWRTNSQRLATISFWTRVPAIVLTAALGVLLFGVARDLFGDRAALFSVALFTFEPTLLAHGRVVQTDVPSAFGYLLLFYALRRHWLSPTWRSAVLLGLSAGLALLAKYSMLISGPILAVYFLALLKLAPSRSLSRNKVWSQAGITLLTLLIVVNAAYFFQSRDLSMADAEWAAAAFPSSSEAVLATIHTLAWIVPTDFVVGVFWQLWHSKQGHSASLLGMFSQTGWWYYFPVAFALKTTLPFLMLSLAAIVWGFYRTVFNRSQRVIFVLVPFVIYTVFVMLSSINIGIRYYIPAFIFLFILAGAMLDHLLSLSSPRVMPALIILILGWSLVETARAYPHYMSYTNQLASRAPNWYYLSDSNVEWGDDIRELADYLHARGETRVRGMLLGGFVTLNFYGVDYIDVLSPPDESTDTRYIAIGASFLNGSTVPDRLVNGQLQTETERVNTFEAFRHRAPEAIFGGSIYLYRER